MRIQNFLFEPRDLLLVSFADLLNQVIFRIDLPLHPFTIDTHLVITFLKLRDMLIQVNFLVF